MGMEHCGRGGLGGEEDEIKGRTIISTRTPCATSSQWSRSTCSSSSCLVRTPGMLTSKRDMSVSSETSVSGLSNLSNLAPPAVTAVDSASVSSLFFAEASAAKA